MLLNFSLKWVARKRWSKAFIFGLLIYTNLEIGGGLQAFGQHARSSNAPTAEDFPAPPTKHQSVWAGPFIADITTIRCWQKSLDNSEPLTSGVDGWQSIVGYVRLPPTVVARIDERFIQEDFHRLSRGGSAVTLQPGAVPQGVWLTARAHPVLKTTKVKIIHHHPDFQGPAIEVSADFRHGPSSGECYLHLAAWVAQVN